MHSPSYIYWLKYIIGFGDMFLAYNVYLDLPQGLMMNDLEGINWLIGLIT